ncbi:MAG: transposase [bacterium]
MKHNRRALHRKIPVRAPNILGPVGNLLRFSNVKSYQCYCGLVPKKKQSSGKDLKGCPSPRRPIGC